MALIYIPKYEEILGSNCTGVEGPGRTYTLVNAGAVAEDMQISIDSGAIQQGRDFSVLGQIITFNVVVFNPIPESAALQVKTTVAP